MYVRTMAIAAGTIGLMVAPVFAAEEPGASPVGAEAFAQAVERAIDFLQNKAQAPDGSYAAGNGPGVTAVVTASLLRHGRTPNDPLVAKSLKYLQGFVQADGGVSLKSSMYRNYETSLARCVLPRPIATATMTG